MQAEHVNIHGKSWNPSTAAVTAKKKPKTEAPAAFHKGWMVEGIPPGALDAAEAAHNKKAASERRLGRLADDFDREHWLMNARKKRVRSRPYETSEGAAACKALAEKSGWLRVVVEEQKKDAGKPVAALGLI